MLNMPLTMKSLGSNEQIIQGSNNEYISEEQSIVSDMESVQRYQEAPVRIKKVMNKQIILSGESNTFTVAKSEKEYKTLQKTPMKESLREQINIKTEQKVS